MQKRRLALWTTLLLATLFLAACSTGSSSFGKYYLGRTLHINVVTMERVPELRYATIDPEEVVRHWRLVPSGENLELVMVRLKLENHTATSAIFTVDEQAAQLRDFVRETYFPIDLDKRLYQDLRGQSAVDVHMDKGNCFDPNWVYVTPGTTVKWINDGEVAHYVELDRDAGIGDQTSIGPGESFSYTFAEPGVWDYQCGVQDQPGLDARVVVEGEGGQEQEKVRSMVFIDGSFELQKDMGIDGWMVFEAPKGTKFRDFRWRAGDSITITF